VDEAASQWEDVKLTIETVLFLRRGLVESEIALEYRFLRGFLAHGSDMFDQRKMSNRGQLKTRRQPRERATFKHFENVRTPEGGGSSTGCDGG
jgi:hypothetical protein